ncbi:MAG: lipoprotein [Pseudomonadota bacterium]
MTTFRSPALRLLALAAALSLTLSACGRRGDPVPPPPDEPASEEPATSGTSG